MTAICAAVCFLIGFIVNAMQPAHVSPWWAPISMICAGGFFLALHLFGVGTWLPRRPQ